MKCPRCGHTDTEVVEVIRLKPNNPIIWTECLYCFHDFLYVSKENEVVIVSEYVKVKK